MIILPIFFNFRIIIILSGIFIFGYIPAPKTGAQTALLGERRGYSIYWATPNTFLSLVACCLQEARLPSPRYRIKFLLHPVTPVRPSPPPADEPSQWLGPPNTQCLGLQAQSNTLSCDAQSNPHNL